MKRFFLTVIISFGVFACEHNKSDKASEANKTSLEESRKIDPSIKVEASHRDFPSFEAWSKISSGMTEAQVIKILGRHKSGDYWRDIKAFPESDKVVYQWSYGSLYSESESHPFRSDFDITFSKGLVVGVDGPFGGAKIIPSGIPTAPRLFVPEDNTVFNHFPRVIDLRWWSSSGTMPITFEVSIEVKYPSGEWGIEGDLQKSSDSLHVAMIFPGSNEGRWRVRGRNQEGAGEWSEFRKFKFTR